MRKRSGDPFIDVSGFEDLRQRANFLGKYAFADALQQAVNELADRGVEELSYRWAGAIEGGPVAFANVDPRKRSSAVTARKRKGATKGIAEASVAVRPKQSAFLKYQLGEDETREAGDVGAATKLNFIPVVDTLRNALGIRVNKHGNLPRNALSKLVSVAKEGRVGKADQGRDAKGRFTKTEAGARAGTVFFGTPRAKKGPQRKGFRTTVAGFWWRPIDRRDRIRPLAFGVEQSKYPKQNLVPVWNESMTEAGADMPAILRPILERIIDERWGRANRAYGKKLADGRARRSTSAALRQMKLAAEQAASGMSPAMVTAAKAAERKAKRAAYDRARREASKARG